MAVNADVDPFLALQGYRVCEGSGSELSCQHLIHSSLHSRGAVARLVDGLVNVCSHGVHVVPTVVCRIVSPPHLVVESRVTAACPPKGERKKEKRPPKGCLAQVPLQHTETRHKVTMTCQFNPESTLAVLGLRPGGLVREWDAIFMAVWLSHRAREAEPFEPSYRNCPE